jgi:hypothetical protein
MEDKMGGDIPEETVNELIDQTPEAYIEQISNDLADKFFDEPQLELPLESE